MGVISSKKTNLKTKLVGKRFETLDSAFLKLSKREIWIVQNEPYKSRYLEIPKGLCFQVLDIFDYQRFPNKKILCALIDITNMNRKYIKRRKVFIEIDKFFQVDHEIVEKCRVKEIK